ncbi:hypothetical protein L3X38_005694 [Prunus dulcis]|uniref:Uncharacterized protein n=1 Tax=Prunus dulcis TaxID=3755 RepID=A0AAD5F4C5_PRUDU|nr:hypothetical protein L3X38_005694 [Prunus dulcis]
MLWLHPPFPSRWLNVWTPVPDIEIDDYSLRDIDHDQCHSIVGKILSPPMPPPLELSKVKMKFYDHTYPAEITTLIRASLKRIVKELDLSICPDDEEVNFQLPMEVFTNQHLQVLKLSKVKVVVPPDSRPSFKVLHVVHVILL